MAPENGGPSYTVRRLSEALIKHDLNALIFTVREANTPASRDIIAFPHGLICLPILKNMRFSPQLYNALTKESASAAVIHSHGLWLMPNVYAGRAAAHAAKPVIVSPRGMLAPSALNFSRTKKMLFWHLLQQRAYAGAAAWHATSNAEADDIRAFGIDAPIAVIPNGIDLPRSTASHDASKACRSILFLSRLHPKKNIPTLIEAWRRLASDRPAWQLLIVGPDEGGHRAELEKQILADNMPRVEILPPVYGEEKERLLTSSDLFILPTLDENFGIAVAEALAAGVPAVVTKGAPWAGLVTERCGWWIDHGIAALEAALRDATALMPSERRVMGLRGRDWMARDFGWDAIGRDMVDVYRWMTGTGEHPSCVRID